MKVAALFIFLSSMSSIASAVCQFDGPGGYCRGEPLSTGIGNLTEFVSVPNSDWIVAISDGKGQKDLIAINRTNFKLKYLTETSSDEESPSISPDGKKLAFISRATDPLGNVAIATISQGKNFSIKLAEEVSLPNTQESHPSINNQMVVFASKKATESNSRVLLRQLGQKINKIMGFGDSPVISGDGLIVLNRNGKFILTESGKKERSLFIDDGFLRRAPSFSAGNGLNYLRYSTDSNGDGVIDSTDGYEFVSADLGSGQINERIQKYGDHQTIEFEMKADKITTTERTRSGYQIVDYLKSNLSCSLLSSSEAEQYENYISLCSETSYGLQVSNEWRFFIRNLSLSHNKSILKMMSNLCHPNSCSFNSITKVYEEQLKALLESRSTERPPEVVIDFALRANRLKPEEAFILIKQNLGLSPYTVARILKVMSTSKKYDEHLRKLSATKHPIVGFMSSMAMTKEISAKGESDLAINQLAFLIREYDDKGADVSLAISEAASLASAANLRGIMNVSFEELLSAQFKEPWIKEKTVFEAKRFLVQEGNDAIAKREPELAKSSFKAALRFDKTSLGAKKGLISLGGELESDDKMGVLLKKSTDISTKIVANERRTLALNLLKEINDLAGDFSNDSEFFRLVGWVNYQIYLSEKMSENTALAFLRRRGDILRGVFGMQQTNYLEDALDAFRRAERIERNFGRISPLLSQDLAIALYEHGDFKEAFSQSLERIRSISALEFEDAEVATYFLNLASAAAGKLDEFDLAIQLAESAEKEARKTNDAALLKVKKAKVYLYFQSGRYLEAAKQAEELLASPDPVQIQRFGILRTWFFKLAGDLGKAQTEFTKIDYLTLEKNRLGLGEEVYQLANWLQREMMSLPKEKGVILTEVAKKQDEIGFFGRLKNRVFGNTDVFISRAKLAIDSAQKLSRAGLFSDAEQVLVKSRSDLERVANDIFNRETPSIIENWLDLRLVTTKSQGQVDQEIELFLSIVEKACAKLENGDKNKNCIAIKATISSRRGLALKSYTNKINFHPARPFYYVNPEQISAFLHEEKAKLAAGGRWIALVGAGQVESGLEMWAKQVLKGELRSFDLDEVMEYFSRLSEDAQGSLLRSEFHAAILVRKRQKLGFSPELIASRLSEVSFEKESFETNSSLPKASFSYFLSGKAFKRGYFVMDAGVSSVSLAEEVVKLPVSDIAATKFIPLQVDASKLASMTGVYESMRKDNILGLGLIVCESTLLDRAPSPKIRDMLDQLFVETFDIFEGRIIVSGSCSETLKGELAKGEYFDQIDTSLSDADFFSKWSEGLSHLEDGDSRSSLLDRLAKELIGRKNNVLAFQIFSVIAETPKVDAPKAFTSLATIGSYLKKWELASGALDRLESYIQSHEVGLPVKLDLLRMRAIIAESSADKSEVEKKWRKYIEVTLENKDFQKAIKGFVSYANFLLDKVSDFEGAKKHYNEAIKIGVESSNPTFEARFGLAMVDMRSNSFSKALSALRELEKDSSAKDNDLSLLKINQQMNSALFGLGRLAEASIRQEKSRLIYPKLSSTALRTRYEILDLNLSAMILAKQGWLIRANEQFNRAIALGEESKLNDLVSLVSANQGFWMRANGQVETSVKNYERSLSLDDVLDATSVASDKRNLGLAQLANLDLSEAYKNLTDSEAASEKLGLGPNLALSRMGLAEVLYKRSNFKEALQKIDLVVLSFMKDYSPEYFWKALYARSEIHRKLGHDEEAAKDLNRALLITLQFSPGQRKGVGPQTTWVDITIRDVLDRWLNFNAMKSGNLSVGLMAQFQYRGQIDYLTSIPGASKRLSELVQTLSQGLSDGFESIKISDADVSSKLASLSEPYAAKLPHDSLVLWALRDRTLGFLGSKEGFSGKEIPFERSTLIRYGEFSDKLLTYIGEAEIFSKSIYNSLLFPIFKDDIPPSLSLLTSEEFEAMPFEMLGPKAGAYLGVLSNINWMTPRLNSDMKGTEFGFWGGTVFDGLPALDLVKHEAVAFKRSFKGQVVLDGKIKGGFRYLEVSGHHRLGADGLPVLALGKGLNLSPLDIFDQFPNSEALYLNFCGTQVGSSLIRAMATAKGTNELIDARGAVSEISSLSVAKALIPPIASGQKLGAALQMARGILVKEGKHPSDWARFRSWNTY